MPKRKSKVVSRRVITSSTSSIQYGLATPYRLTMLIPNKLVEGTTDEFIHTRFINRNEAHSIVEKYKDKVYLVSEKIDEQERLLTPIVRLPELLIAMEVIPLGSLVLSSYDIEQIENDDITVFEDMGVHLLNNIIAPSLDKIEEYDTNAYVMSITDDEHCQLDWLGEIPKHIIDWINLRFYAMNILNCCYIGRGAPAGVNLKEQSNKMASESGLLVSFLDIITSSMRTLPDMEYESLPSWQERILWESRIEQHYQKALKDSENFREFFYYHPIAADDVDVAVVDEEFKNIKELLRHIIAEYEKGEESTVPDIIWTKDGTQQMVEILEEIGAISTIEAYLSGVPFEDIIV